MRWEIQKPFAGRSIVHQWHMWFAWFPVRVPVNGKRSGMTIVWLESIERRGRYFSPLGDVGWGWEYRWPANNHNDILRQLATKRRRAKLEAKRRRDQ